MVNVHNSKTRTLWSKDPALQRNVQICFGDVVIRFTPATKEGGGGGGEQIGVATSMQGLVSHKTQLKTALWLRSTNEISPGLWSGILRYVFSSCIVNRGEWLWSPANIKGVNKDAKI